MNFSRGLRKPSCWVGTPRAAGLKFGPHGLTAWDFTRMPGGRWGSLCLPSCLCRQDVWASLLSMDLIHLQESQCQSVVKQEQAIAPVCHAVFYLPLFFQRTDKKSHKEVRWCWQNMTTTGREQGLPGHIYT